MKLSTRSFLASVLCLATLFNVACGGVRAAARGVEVGAQEIAREVEAMRRDGELTDAEAASVTPILNEIESSAHVLGLSSVNYDSLTPAGKRELLLRFVGELEQSVGRLESQGLVFKSEKARRALAGWRTRVRRGIAAIRVIEAALPQPKASASSSAEQ